MRENDGARNWHGEHTVELVNLCTQSALVRGHCPDIIQTLPGHFPVEETAKPEHLHIKEKDGIDSHDS